MWTILAEMVQPYLDLLPRLSSRPQSNEWCVVDAPLVGAFSTRWALPWIPAFMSVEYFPKHEVDIDLEIQTLMTSDGTTVTLNAAVTYEIVDPVKMREIWGSNHEGIMGILIRHWIAEQVISHPASEINSHIKDLREAAERVILGGSEHSVQVVNATVEDVAHTTGLRIYATGQSNMGG